MITKKVAVGLTTVVLAADMIYRPAEGHPHTHREVERPPQDTIIRASVYNITPQRTNQKPYFFYQYQFAMDEMPPTLEEVEQVAQQIATLSQLLADLGGKNK